MNRTDPCVEMFLANERKKADLKKLAVLAAEIRERQRELELLRKKAGPVKGAGFVMPGRAR